MIWLYFPWYSSIGLQISLSWPESRVLWGPKLEVAQLSSWCHFFCDDCFEKADVQYNEHSTKTQLSHINIYSSYLLLQNTFGNFALGVQQLTTHPKVEFFNISDFLNFNIIPNTIFHHGMSWDISCWDGMYIPYLTGNSK